MIATFRLSDLVALASCEDIAALHDHHLALFDICSQKDLGIGSGFFVSQFWVKNS